MKLGTALHQVNRLFLDTAPVIYYVDVNPAYFALMDQIFTWIESNSIRIVTSPVTLAECLILPIRQKDLSQQQLFVEILTDQNTADFTETNAAIAETAAESRARYNLKLPDALQVATALEAGCQAFLTNDAQLKQVLTWQLLILHFLG